MGAAWSSVAPVCAAALTNLTGARQQVADMLGVDELADTLDRNRVSREAVDAMWAACDDVVPDLVRYLNKKASLLGKERLDAWDLSAPLPGADAAVPWDDAVHTITSSFDVFSPSLGAFARAAVADRWIDGEPGPGRAQGGFCAFMPETGESRIFLTFGDARSVVTLAHELGHAWHNRWLAENPPGQRRLTSATAESASTFAETLYRDAASAAAASPDQKRRKLDEDLQAAVAYLMNIRGRYALERRLFELRREGALTPDTLRAETRRCFDHAYGGAVAHIDDMFWASKLHFYIPEFGFYNWPYTFGYLLSGALSARARAEGPAFEPVLARFLRATGWLDASEAAREALGADLTDPAFWSSAMGLLRAKVDAFCAE
jgi:oligoendopeptidase F